MAQSIGPQFVIMDGDEKNLLFRSTYHPTPYIIQLKSELKSRRSRTIGDQWKDGIPPSDFPLNWIHRDTNLSLTGGYSTLIKEYEDDVNKAIGNHETKFKK
jgi:hypothetical protein